MDNQRDFYIKSKFQEDDLISKKANDVFDNFFKGEIKMENEKTNINNTENVNVNLNENVNATSNEKVVNMNDAKEKKLKRKKMMSMVATLVVVFLGANVFAATQGYNNIFFIINNLINPTVVTDKNEILTDRDLTISYQSIEISEGLRVQINRLVVSDNEAILYLDIDNEKAKEEIETVAVYDITDGKKELIANQILSSKEGRYTEKIELTKYSNATKSIQLDFQDSKFNKICSLEINLDKKEINILTAVEKEMEKISEVELKEFLSKVVRINFFKDKDSITQYHSEREYRDEIKVLYALEVLDKEKASFDEVHKVIEELTGSTVESYLDLANVVVTKTDDGYKYVAGKDSHQVHALCLEVADIKYFDGVYTADCIYTYPTDKDYKNNTIEKLDKFTTTIEFVLNENYEYVKYRILNVDEFKGTLYEDINEKTEIDDLNTNNKENNEDNSNDLHEATKPNMPNNQEGNENSSTTKPNNSAVNSTVHPGTTTNPEKVDNYASTMTWVEFFTPGLRGVMPAGWNIQEFTNGYSGPEDDGKLAKTVSGIAKGIDKETGRIIESNLTINFYMPEFIVADSSYGYSKIVANRYNMEASEAGFTSKEGMDWKMVVEPYGNREFYCHFEPLANSEDGIGYTVEIICDNNFEGYTNYKVINIINWIFGNLRGASF